MQQARNQHMGALQASPIKSKTYSYQCSTGSHSSSYRKTIREKGNLEELLIEKELD